MHFSIDRTVHTTAFDKPVVEHWLERKIKNKEGKQEMFYIMTHSTHFIYGYMSSDIW